MVTWQLLKGGDALWMSWMMQWMWMAVVAGCRGQWGVQVDLRVFAYLVVTTACCRGHLLSYSRGLSRWSHGKCGGGTMEIERRRRKVSSLSDHMLVAPY